MKRIISAVPGSGKTTRIVEEVGKLIANGVSSRNIAVVTFSNSATDELRRRINNDGVVISTIHSLAGRLTERDHRASFISYTDVLEAAAEFVRNADSLPFTTILVDEAQDIDYHQFRFLREVISKCENAIVVGDPMQSIYEFASASPDYMFKLMDDAELETMNVSYRCKQGIASFVNSICKTDIVPSQTSGGIVYLADHPITTTLGLAEKSKRKYSIALIVRTNREVMSAVNALRDFREVNYRISGFTAESALALSAIMQKRGIPWDIFATALRSVSNISPYSFRTVAQTLSLAPVTIDILRSIPKQIARSVTSDARVALTTLERILSMVEYSEPISGKVIMGIVSNVVDILDTPRSEMESIYKSVTEFLKTGERPVYAHDIGAPISVMTAHASKGREYQHVVISLEQFDRLNDYRVFYVASTRAMETLGIYLPQVARTRRMDDLFERVLTEFGNI